MLGEERNRLRNEGIIAWGTKSREAIPYTLIRKTPHRQPDNAGLHSGRIEPTNMRTLIAPNKAILEQRTSVLRNTCLVIAVLAVAVIVTALVWPVLMIAVTLGQREG